MFFRLAQVSHVSDGHAHISLLRVLDISRCPCCMVSLSPCPCCTLPVLHGHSAGISSSVSQYLLEYLQQRLPRVRVCAMTPSFISDKFEYVVKQCSDYSEAVAWDALDASSRLPHPTR